MTQRKRWFYTILALLAVQSLAIALSWPSLTKPQLSQTLTYANYSCETSTVADTPLPLTLLLLAPLGAEDIANTLCENPLIQQHYTQVQVHWMDRNHLQASHLLDEKFDILWSRSHVLSGILPNYTDYYAEAATFDQYAVYWYSRQPIQNVNAEWLNQQRIGLLNDGLSQTHYILPLQSMRAMGLSSQQQNVTLYDQAEHLYSDFFSGKVSVITAGEWLEPMQPSVRLYKALITDKAVAATIFVNRSRSELINDPQTLDQLVVAMKSIFTEHLATESEL
ncbi:hypothetical protein [Pseudidiomarina sediminum]|uniref:hypothetical protein n=1 Tax=Pseudidiomarina sediminum TaxID=431675 RepID=UPI001C97435F|nr:hypothetical protein [Pseudidiomarina sediminum]MBY6063696.1 hypothetical protein [Pseudidiomarina sediminum]